MDGRAAHATPAFALDPCSGAFFVFRSTAGDRLKVPMWDGTGPVPVCERIEAARVVGPKIRGGTLTLSGSRFEALFEGLDWRQRPATPAQADGQLTARTVGGSRTEEEGVLHGMIFDAAGDAGREDRTSPGALASPITSIRTDG